MPSRTKNYAPRRTEDEKDIELFDSAIEAWFWYINAQRARDEGARITAGQALVARPCEPIDILKVVDRLWNEAMDRMEGRLIEKQILHPRPARHSNWMEEAHIYESVEWSKK